MGKSRRRTPKRGITTSDSEKLDKRIANRRLRRKNKVLVAKGEEPVRMREISNKWCFAKDGSFYFDPTQYPDLMRK